MTNDPAVVAAVSARATSRHTHHEAGHAVAVVASGGKLIDVFIGTVDWSTSDMSGDIPGGTVHETAYADQPFVTFAGPWAEAMWTVENDLDVDDFEEALEYAWDNSIGGDTDKYENRIAMLEAAADQLGFSRVGRAWELDWSDRLGTLWPAIRGVAAMLVDGQPVTHEMVSASISRCLDDSESIAGEEDS